MDTMQLPTLIEGNNGFGGAGLGAGFIGGLVLGSIWNGGGWGGWGGNGRGVMQAGADVALANSIEHVGDAVNQSTISQLQSTNQLMNSINQSVVAGMQGNNQLSQQIDQTGDNTISAINQNTIQGMTNTQAVGEKLCCINNNITSQGYEARLQNQALAAQLAGQHAELSRQIFEENCKDRELQREIQSQAIRDQLTQAQAANAALAAQINLTNQLTQQTAYLIDQLKTTTTTTQAG